jgi:hypothetical protein
MERLSDGGPVYFETDLNRFIVEPWNAFTSLTFLVPVFYLLWILRGRYKEFTFLVFWAAPLMAIGGIGSTIYHAFRVSPFFLIMDVLPIALLTLSVGIYLWLKILSRWWWVLVVIATSIGLRFLAFYIFKGNAQINASYFITGATIFIPGILFLFKTRFFEFSSLGYSVIFLALALFFRFADDYNPPLLPNGTHWLWHIFTSAGAIFLSVYLVRIKNIRVKPLVNEQSKQ